MSIPCYLISAEQIQAFTPDEMIAFSSLLFAIHLREVQRYTHLGLLTPGASLTLEAWQNILDHIVSLMENDQLTESQRLLSLIDADVPENNRSSFSKRIRKLIAQNDTIYASLSSEQCEALKLQSINKINEKDLPNIILHAISMLTTQEHEYAMHITKRDDEIEALRALQASNEQTPSMTRIHCENFRRLYLPNTLNMAPVGSTLNLINEDETFLMTAIISDMYQQLVATLQKHNLLSPNELLNETTYNRIVNSIIDDFEAQRPILLEKMEALHAYKNTYTLCSSKLPPHLCHNTWLFNRHDEIVSNFFTAIHKKTLEEDDPLALLKTAGGTLSESQLNAFLSIVSQNLGFGDLSLLYASIQGVNLNAPCSIPDSKKILIKRLRSRLTLKLSPEAPSEKALLQPTTTPLEYGVKALCAVITAATFYYAFCTLSTLFGFTGTVLMPVLIYSIVIFGLLGWVLADKMLSSLRHSTREQTPEPTPEAEKKASRDTTASNDDVEVIALDPSSAVTRAFSTPKALTSMTKEDSKEIRKDMPTYNLTNR